MSKLLKFETRAEFDIFIKTNSGLDNVEDALASENNGVYGSVVYILDTKEIYANNQINTPEGGGDSDDSKWALKIELENKVDKVEGMGLSSNDYTTEDKNKVASMDSTYATKQYVEDNEQITYDVVNHGTSDASYAVTPNVFHVWDTVSSLSITLATPTDDTIMNEYLFQFTSGSIATSLSTPSTVVWISEPSIEANKTYQVSIVNNIGIIASVDA